MQPLRRQREHNPGMGEREDITMTDTEKRINELFEELVPDTGKADTVAGEIIRAVSRIGYRYYNDGDHIGVGYGRETCNPAARYLANKAGSRVERAISDMWGIEHDGKYGELLETLNKEVLAYLDWKPELKTTPNSEDMWDFTDKEEDVDDYDDEDDYEDTEDYDDEEDGDNE
jgi:hypothetical protein